MVVIPTMLSLAIPISLVIPILVVIPTMREAQRRNLLFVATGE